MGKTSTKLAVYSLVQLLLFHLSGPVAAVDYFFHVRDDDCVGPSYMHLNARPVVCVQSMYFTAGSVRVESTNDQRTVFYGGGRCRNLKFTSRGSGCAMRGGYTGVIWMNGTRHSLLADDAEKACNAQMKPTGIAYSEESTKGHWILTTDNATEMYTQMDTIPYAQKVDWLQAHGATFRPGL